MARDYLWTRIFFTNKNPAPVKSELGDGYTVPYWYVLGFLENVAAENKVKPNDQTTNLLIEIADAIIDYKINGKRIDNFRTDLSLIKVLFSLPIEKIGPKHIVFVSTVLHGKFGQEVVSNEILKTCIPVLVNTSAKSLLLQLIGIILEYKEEESSYFSRYGSILGDYWLDEILTKYKTDFIRICGLDLYDIVKEKIDTIIKRSNGTEFGGIITIEGSSQNLSEDYRTQLVYFLRDILISQDPLKVRPIIYDLIVDTKAIMRRLAIFTISEHYDVLKDIFWSITTNPIEDTALKHELYELFKKNNNNMTEPEINQIVRWIETESFDYSQLYESNNDARKSMAYHRKEWLSSIIDSGNRQVSDLYKKYDAIFGAKLEHPGYLVWSSGVIIESPKPMSEEVIGRTNREVADFLRSLSSKIDEQSDRFRAYVRNNPQRFSQDMDVFLQIPIVFQKSLLEGLTEAIRDKKDINWSQTFGFISKLINEDTFWTATYNKMNYRVWISKEIADLIEVGIRNNAFTSPDISSQASELLIVLASHDSAEFNIEFSLDLVNSVLNSPRGAIFMAMVNLALKHQKPTPNENWSGAIKDYFTRAIKKEAQPSVELYVTLGEYLVFMYYNLERKWVKDNINLLLPKEEELYWIAGFSSYLFSASQVYKDIFDLLVSNGHYAKALNVEFNEKLSKDRIADHIAIAYLNQFEEIENPQSLIAQLISKQDPELVRSIVSLVWRSAEKINEIQKSRAIILWKKLVSSLEKGNDTESKKTLASLFRWISIIQKLDEQSVDLLKTSLRNASSESEIMFVVDDLMKHVQSTPHEVGELYLELLHHGMFPFHPQDKIQELVKVLYENKEKKAATEICDLYWKKRYFFLKEVSDYYS